MANSPFLKVRHAKIVIQSLIYASASSGPSVVSVCVCLCVFVWRQGAIYNEVMLERDKRWVTQARISLRDAGRERGSQQMNLRQCNLIWQEGPAPVGIIMLSRGGRLMMTLVRREAGRYMKAGCVCGWQASWLGCLASACAHKNHTGGRMANIQEGSLARTPDRRAYGRSCKSAQTLLRVSLNIRDLARQC